MALHTINAKQLDAGSIIVLPNGTRRAVAAIDDTATHVYLDFADGGCGIYELDALVTVERTEVPFRTEHALCGKCGPVIVGIPAE